jgi:pimeloyl-ACP methyl ester carboxylesterase
VKVGGVQLHAKLLSPEAGTPESSAVLVFLHEGLGSIEQWRDFPEQLVAATGLRALVYDRYGYGGSDPRNEPPNPHYLAIEAFDRLPALLEACRIKTPILIGHSDGATIALLYGAEYPSSPLGIISEAAHVMIEDVTIQGIRRAFDAYQSTSLRAQLERYHDEKVDSVFHGWADTWLTPAFREWKMLDRLRSIIAPVLAIQGADDEYGTLAQLDAIATGVSGPVEILNIDNCGHVPHFQARQQVADAMVSFVRQCIET